MQSITHSGTSKLPGKRRTEPATALRCFFFAPSHHKVALATVGDKNSEGGSTPGDTRTVRIAPLNLDGVTPRADKTATRRERDRAIGVSGEKDL